MHHGQFKRFRHFDPDESVGAALKANAAAATHERVMAAAMGE